MGFELDILNGDEPSRDLHSEDDRARYWLSLSKEERALRVVMEAIEKGEGHSWCRALRKATRPLHVTTIWTDRPCGFAFQFEGEYEGTWVVRPLPSGTGVFDVVLVECDPSLPSRGVLLRAESVKDDSLGGEWIGAFEQFLEQRGLLPTAPLFE